MALFPTTLIPYSSTPLVAPSPKISDPVKSGKVTTRKNPAVGHTWTEMYLIDPLSGSHRGWMSAVQALTYRGSMITNKKHYLYDALQGAGGALKVSGSGQTGTSVILYGATGNSTPLKAGDLIQFLSGSSVTPVYQVASDVVADASGGCTASVVPDVLSEFQPANASTLALTPNVSLSCEIINAGYPALDIQSTRNFAISVPITFRETPL